MNFIDIAIEKGWLSQENLDHAKKIKNNYNHNLETVIKILDYLTDEQIKEIEQQQNLAVAKTVELTFPQQHSSENMEQGLAIDSLFAKKYTIVTKIGHGGMGMVYKAQSEKHGLVALKVLTMEEENKRILTTRFKKRESKALWQHKNIIRVYDAGEFDNVLYLVMEKAQGSLTNLIKKEKILDEYLTYHIIGQILQGLMVIHDSNFIHRDIKPDNILISNLNHQEILSSDSNIKVSDFGLIRPIIPKESFISGEKPCGTIGYMSPEQFSDPTEITISSDLYSLGVLMYECLHGKVPFDGTAMAIWEQQKQKPKISSNINSKGKELLTNLLAYSSSDRPPSASAILEQYSSLFGLRDNIFKQNKIDDLCGSTIAPKQDKVDNLDGTTVAPKITNIVMKHLTPQRLQTLQLQVIGSENILFLYGGSELTFGRELTNTGVCLRSKSDREVSKQISRKHFKLLLHQNQPHIVDLESRAGTLLNGRSLIANQKQILHDNQELAVAGLMKLQVQTFQCNYDINIDGFGEVTKKVAAQITRENDAAEHSYLWLPGVVNLNIDEDCLTATGGGEVQIINHGGYFWLAENNSNQCKILFPGSSFSIGQQQVKVTEIEIQKQDFKGK